MERRAISTNTNTNIATKITTIITTTKIITTNNHQHHHPYHYPSPPHLVLSPILDGLGRHLLQVRDEHAELGAPVSNMVESHLGHGKKNAIPAGGGYARN